MRKLGVREIKPKKDENNEEKQRERRNNGKKTSRKKKEYRGHSGEKDMKKTMKDNT